MSTVLNENTKMSDGNHFEEDLPNEIKNVLPTFPDNIID